jgi:hypothetical protein
MVGVATSHNYSHTPFWEELSVLPKQLLFCHSGTETEQKVMKSTFVLDFDGSY